MLIRDYRSTDYPSIVRLWDETGVGGEERGDNQKIIEECISIGGKFLVLEEEQFKSVVGTSWMTFDGRRLHLHHFCIRPDCQGQGLGIALTRESLRFVKKTGYQVKLEVHSENKRAIKIYEKFGFFKFDDFDILMIRDVNNIQV